MSQAAAVDSHHLSYQSYTSNCSYNYVDPLKLIIAEGGGGGGEPKLPQQLHKMSSLETITSTPDTISGMKRPVAMMSSTTVRSMTNMSIMTNSDNDDDEELDDREHGDDPCLMRAMKQMKVSHQEQQKHLQQQASQEQRQPQDPFHSSFTTYSRTEAATASGQFAMYHPSGQPMQEHVPVVPGTMTTTTMMTTTNAALASFVEDDNGEDEFGVDLFRPYRYYHDSHNSTPPTSVRFQQVFSSKEPAPPLLVVPTTLSSPTTSITTNTVVEQSGSTMHHPGTTTLARLVTTTEAFPLSAEYLHATTPVSSSTMQQQQQQQQDFQPYQQVNSFLGQLHQQRLQKQQQQQQHLPRMEEQTLPPANDPPFWNSQPSGSVVLIKHHEQLERQFPPRPQQLQHSFQPRKVKLRCDSKLG